MPPHLGCVSGPNSLSSISFRFYFSQSLRYSLASSFSSSGILLTCFCLVMYRVARLSAFFSSGQAFCWFRRASFLSMVQAFVVRYLARAFSSSPSTHFSKYSLPPLQASWVSMGGLVPSIKGVWAQHPRQLNVLRSYGHRSVRS